MFIIHIVSNCFSSDPYTTIKMKCYYHDNQTYGDSWQQLLNDKTKCHEELFERCFKDRATQGRHETHVLTFRRVADIKSCVCTGNHGWYTIKCFHSMDVYCCLDRGKDSVKCSSWRQSFVFLWFIILFLGSWLFSL